MQSEIQKRKVLSGMHHEIKRGWETQTMDAQAIIGQNHKASTFILLKRLLTPIWAMFWLTSLGSAASFQGLGDLPGGDFQSSVEAVTADGTVVVGYSRTASGFEAFRWQAETGMIGLGDFAGGWTNSNGYGISADGTIVVGYGYSGVFDDYTHEAFRWTAASGLVPLGFGSGHHTSVARSVSADGNIVVGDAEIWSALIWTPQDGMRNLQEVLIQDYGLDLTGWTLTQARAITPDGRTIVGTGTNPAGKNEGWIVNLKPTLPQLDIHQEANQIVLCWPMHPLGLVLEQTASLANGCAWKACLAPVNVSGEKQVVTLDVSHEAQFFRLKEP